MPIIKRECIEHIREVADLYDIVSGYVQLRRSGGNWKGLSPFTVEKTPSFFVLPEKKFFKCFSTGYAGDIFRFLELKENLSFIEAVEWLAKHYGISLEYGENRYAKSYSKNELLEIHEDAAAYYRRNFRESPDVQRYWTETRRFSPEAAERYGIGWAPKFDRGLLALLRRKTYTLEALQQCGLLLWNENDPQNFRLRFTGRLMIPIYDVQNRVVAFAGRIIESSGDFSKYINSPETPIFSKGSMLYGLHRARKFVTDHFTIVEGPLDAIRCWENGIQEAIAPQGTGITEVQMHLLRRYASKLLCLTDGDGAGQKCALRVVELSFRAGLESRIIALGEGDDPDSLLLRDGRAGFDRLREEAMIPFMARVLLPRGEASTAVEREHFLKKIYEMIRTADSEVTQNAYLDELALHLNLDRRAIGNDFRNFCGDTKFAIPGGVRQGASQGEGKIKGKLHTAEYDLLSLVLHYGHFGQKIAYIIDDGWLSGEHGNLLQKVLNEVREDLWEGPRENSPVFSESELNELFSILAEDSDVEDPLEAVNACIRSLYTAFVKQKLASIDQKISQQRKFTKDKNLLDDVNFFENLQAEKLHLRQLLISCPKIEGVK
ncbi:MAG: DNA primase [Puniceicoccales bacterium]|jgi:DNA primase|nr:DNA primase [Puniceicoccales bacterium]